MSSIKITYSNGRHSIQTLSEFLTSQGYPAFTTIDQAINWYNQSNDTSTAMRANGWRS